MHKKIILTVFIGLLTINAVVGQVKTTVPRCITFEYADLLAIRKSISAGETTYKASYKLLLSTADKLLKKTPEKVTDGDKPPTGDVHDFYAIGKFSWPNPNTPNGMPYIRGDGKYNPDTFGDRFDLTRFQKTVSYINTLTLAWFFTQDEKYAAKASEFLKVWFIDPQTLMNPNMECASALPGVYNGMPIGIIFTVVLIEMADHIQLLRQSKSWDQTADGQLTKWFIAYKKWLTTSPFGKEEQKATNNHGTWHSAQLLAYTLLIGNADGVKEQFELAKSQINSQIMPDGQLPREMKRVEGFHYFIYGLKAFNVMAKGFEQFGYDLWSYKTPDQKSLMLPHQFIIPYITGKKPWTTGGSININDTDALIILKQSAKKYNLPESKEAIDLLRANMGAASIKQLYIVQ